MKHWILSVGVLISIGATASARTIGLEYGMGVRRELAASSDVTLSTQIPGIVILPWDQ